MVLVRGPARSTWDGSSRPTMRSAAAAASIIAARSTPVPTPMSSTMYTSSSVAMLPLAPGAYGQPPSPPTDASKSSTPSSSAARTFASPVPRVLWKCRLSGTSGCRNRNAPARSCTRRGVAMPVVSPNEIASAPSATARPATASTRSTGTSPSYGQPQAVATTTCRVAPRWWASSIMTAISSRDCSVDRLTFLRLWVSEADTTASTSVNPASRALRAPRRFGASAEYLTVGTRSTPAQTSSASAIWGIASARTNETASIRLTPVWPSRSISAIFAGVGTGSSFCSPSLGPTSRSEMRAGRSVMPASLPRPLRLALLVEGGDALAPVGGKCGGAPGRVLHLQPCRQADVRSLPDGPLRRLHGYRRVGRHPAGDLDRLGAGRPLRHDPVGEPDPRGLLRVHPAAGVDQVSGPARAQPAHRELRAAAPGHQADRGLRQAEHGG